MERFVDLHIHTYYSDGTLSPEEVIQAAASQRLAAVSISDHDCLDGLPRAAVAGAAHGVEVLSGVELSAERGKREVHILGYGIDPLDAAVNRQLEAWRLLRVERAKRIVGNLNAQGLSLDYARVDALARRWSGESGSAVRLIGRLHIAQAMTEAGLVGSPDEAFRRYIGDHKPAYVPKAEVTPRQAFDLIHQAGGLAVLAHPGSLGQDEWITEWAAEGLDGLEVYHTDHPAQTALKYLRLADRLGLLVTGGSDCHGKGKGRMLLGGVHLPYDYYERLKKALAARVPGPSAEKEGSR